MRLNVLKILQNEKYFQSRRRKLISKNNKFIDISYLTNNGSRSIRVPAHIEMDERVSWLFGLWIGDKCSQGFGICNKNIDIITKAFSVMKILENEDHIKAIIYYNKSYQKPEKMMNSLKKLGIKNIDLYTSISCRDPCIYLYSLNPPFTFLFRYMIKNFSKFIHIFDKNSLKSILAGIFDAEGTVNLTYKKVSIGLKTRSLELKILTRILKILDIGYKRSMRSNGMTMIKIGHYKEDKLHLNTFYNYIKKYISNSDKREGMKKIIKNRNLIYPHQALHLLYIKNHPGSSRSEIREAFGRKGKESTRVRINNFINEGYIKSSKIMKNRLINTYYIMPKGRVFIRNNMDLISEIIKKCRTNGTWGKGNTYISSPFINEIASSSSISCNEVRSGAESG